MNIAGDLIDNPIVMLKVLTIVAVICLANSGESNIYKLLAKF